MTEKVSLKEFIYRALKDGYILQQIKEILKSNKDIDEQSINTSLNEVNSEINNIWNDDSIANYNSSDERAKWYFGPKEYHIFWNKYKNTLYEKGFSQPNIQTCDIASSKIISYLKAPGTSVFDSKGIVLGYVQSGKTANFLGVISKAADMGYKLFIILSGVTNSLRNQTKSRIRKDIYENNPNYWYFLTTDDEDFNVKRIIPIKEYLKQNWEKKFLCVMKKNSTRLKGFIEWIGNNREELEDIPVILIDDECDQASLNTSKKERTDINNYIIDILNIFPKIAYIGYTATPYANLLVSPENSEDLYPRDFILSLPKPLDYIGSEEIFGSNEIITDEEGNELDDSFPIIEDYVTDTECDLLVPRNNNFKPKEIPDSLKNAILYFWLATAFRWWRENNKTTNYKKPHCTMLIHTHERTDTHVILRNNVLKFKEKILKQIENLDSRNELIRVIQNIWIKEKYKIEKCSYPGKTDDWPNFDEVFTIDSLKIVIKKSVIVMQNSREDDAESEDDLFDLYQNDDGNCYIAIGGNMLSRGLTLEGLLVSYYIRDAGNYDTILQMGRWFGYRKNFLDLIRLWTTEDIYSHFLHIADVDREIREQIEENGHKNLNPRHFPIKIQTADNLTPTSEGKIKDVVYVYNSYSGKIISTSSFPRNNKDWLDKNKIAIDNFITNILKEGIKPKEIRGNKLFKGVSNEILIDFLNEYNLHKESRKFVKREIISYITKEEIVWNVNLLSKSTDISNQTITIAEIFKINLFSRSRIPSKNDDEVNIKALYSKADLFDDLELSKEQFEKHFKTSNRNKISKENLSEIRKKLLVNTGLVLIYPIDKDSKSEISEVKFPLNAASHILAVTLYFPQNEDPEAKNYIQVRIDNE